MECQQIAAVVLHIPLLPLLGLLMNRNEITKLLPELQAFLKILRIFFLILIISVFGSYITALWLWSEGQHTLAFIIASIAFIIFYLLQQRLVNITCSYLSQDTKYTEMLIFIHENLQKKTAKEFLSQLEKAVTIVKKN